MESADTDCHCAIFGQFICFVGLLVSLPIVGYAETAEKKPTEIERDWAKRPPSESYQVQKATSLVEETAKRLSRQLNETTDEDEQTSQALRSGWTPAEFSSSRWSMTQWFESPFVGGDEYFELDLFSTDSDWLGLVEEIQRQNCDKAAESLNQYLDEKSDRQNPMHRYARSRIAECRGKAREADRMYRTLLEAKGIVGQLAKLELGGDSESRGLSTYGLIRKAKQKSSLEGTIEYLKTWEKRVQTAWQSYRLQTAIVDAYRRHGLYEKAGRTLLDIYRRTRDWNIGDRVERRLEQLNRRVDANVFPFGERIDRMRDLIDRHEFDEARQVSIDNAERRGVSGDEIEGWTAFRRGLEAEAKRQRQRAIDYFKRAERLVEDPAVRPRLYFGWARALRRLDRDKEAIELYTRLRDEYPENPLCDDALYYAGILHQFESRHSEARQLFRQLIQEWPESKRAPYARWRAGFSAYLVGKYGEARQLFASASAESPSAPTDAGWDMGLKADYWKGMAFFRLEANQLAKRQFQRVFKLGPLTWYGRLAAARLSELGYHRPIYAATGDRSRRAIQLLDELNIPKDKRLEDAVALIRAGFLQEASKQLEIQLSQYPIVEGTHELMGAIESIRGRTGEAISIANRGLEPSAFHYGNIGTWQVAYPDKYMHLSQKASRRFGLSPYLIQAIMRKESRFQRRAVSSVGASGLMQLMPPTARFVSQTFLNRNNSINRHGLGEPKNNIELGTAYMRYLTGLTNRSIPLALASYNAGTRPARNWFDRFGDREVDAWTELITYGSTRAYVKKVYSNYAVYSALYGGEQGPTPALELPERFDSQIEPSHFDNGKPEKTRPMAIKVRD